MTRTELGLRLQQWHSSMHDPIYAVGSFYFDDCRYRQGDLAIAKRYPDIEIVKDAIYILKRDLGRFERMLAGEKVSAPTAYGKTDDLRKFAGYLDDDLRHNIKDLEEIVSELKRFMREDY